MVMGMVLAATLATRMGSKSMMTTTTEAMAMSSSLRKSTTEELTTSL